MTNAHFIKKAQKDYPESGIKKGDSYWHWAFAFGPKYKSKTQPTRSQLTRSTFYSALFELEDTLGKRFEGIITSEEIQSGIDDLVSEIESLRDETQDSLDNMPEQLKDSSPNQERIDGLESWVCDLQSIDTDIDEDMKDKQKIERAEEIIEEIMDTSSGI